ncbi:MAG TPA: alpha/beta fold hydrolase [Candidatus Binatia bacterium]
MAKDMKTEAKPDVKLQVARSSWGPRYNAAGIPSADFEEVSHSIDRWDDWCRAWSERGALHERIGREALAGGYKLSAGRHLTTAAACYHFAKCMFVDDLNQLRAAHKKAVECRTLALPYLNPPGERIEIPYEGKFLAGNLRKPAGEARPPVVVIISGMDSCKEEHHNVEQVFLERGMATFSFDGPGQGEAEYDFPVRHDFEVPARAVIDWVKTRGDLDGNRIGILGGSMGGYYAARVAAFEKRVKACISASGAFSVLENFDPRPPTLKDVYRLRTHSKTVEEAREKIKAFNLDGVAQNITCPMLVIAAKEDKITRWQDGERLSREVSGPRKFLLIEGANHVAMNRTYCHWTQSADWMAEQLGLPKR